MVRQTTVLSYTKISASIGFLTLVDKSFTVYRLLCIIGPVVTRQTPGFLEKSSVSWPAFGLAAVRMCFEPGMLILLVKYAV
jgi:hypothetical protein